MKTREELLNAAEEDIVTALCEGDAAIVPDCVVTTLSLRAIACILLAQERRKDEERKPQANDALLAACEATDKALTDIQALMRQKGWKIEETDTLDFQLYSTLAEASYKAHAALSKPKEV